MSVPTVVELVAGDTSDTLDVTYTDVDVTGFGVKLIIDYDEPLEIDGEVTDGEAGEFSFSFGPTDLRAGRCRADIRLTDNSDKEHTIKDLILDIAERVDG